MSKQRKRPSTPVAGRNSSGVWLLVIVIAAAAATALWWTSRSPKNSASNNAAFTNTVATNGLAPTAVGTNVPAIEVAQSVMVTQPLDFGDRVPTPAEALLHVERVSRPDDGTGRTFAVLEAFGITNENGKLQLSMRVSTEEPGLAALIFKRTGQVLWQTRVVPRQGPPPSEKQLTVMLEDEDGKQHLVDGSKNPVSILDAAIHQSPNKIRDQWPDGTERTFVFIYSACGCPIKAKVRRVGETTVRTSDWPVLFPDDPDALRVISSLMGWSNAALR